MDNNEAREFWARFDQIKGQRQVKEIVEAAGIEYELIRVQRTRQRLPQLGIINEQSISYRLRG